jgi:hypothetical protein
MANLIYPAASARTVPYDRGIPGSSWSIPMEVIDTDGTAISLLGGGIICVNSTSGAVGITIPATVRVGATFHFISQGGASNDGTITLASGETWDGTNDVATFDANGEFIVAVKASSTRWYVANASSVTFS